MRAVFVPLLPAAVIAAALGFSVARAQAQTSDDAATAAVPQGAPPATQPPAPPQNPPPPPTGGAPAPADQPNNDAGQWVYTDQYGWVWMPYDDAYVYTPPDESGTPYEYLYFPAQGWAWVVAPWVWGVGPLPYFGSSGAWRYHWYRGPQYHPRNASRPLFRGGYVHTSGGRRGGGGRGGGRR